MHALPVEKLLEQVSLILVVLEAVLCPQDLKLALLDLLKPHLKLLELFVPLLRALARSGRSELLRLQVDLRLVFLELLG